ncbi:hypothetical protein [Arthrobacter sp. JCM 19049]|uniref:hypothetical protein n=1 Tax=Arthrobacter sp. JCM 19049 TaxID=1460643 RepID=UPI0027954E5E|nr:hypothetical protein [Arthrobacter sp. JCM 19049]
MPAYPPKPKTLTGKSKTSSPLGSAATTSTSTTANPGALATQPGLDKALDESECHRGEQNQAVVWENASSPMKLVISPAHFSRNLQAALFLHAHGIPI